MLYNCITVRCSGPNLIDILERKADNLGAKEDLVTLLKLRDD